MVLKRNLIANFLGQGWTALMGLAFIPLYIKYLGIEAYGVIGLFALLQAWLSLIEMGITPMLGREMARFTSGSHSNESIRDLLRSVEILAIVVAISISCGIAFSSGWIAKDWLVAEGLPNEVVSQAFTIMGLVTALRFIESIYRSSIIGLQRQILFNILNSIMATIRGIGSVTILIWVSPTIQAFFLWHGVVSIITTTILGVTTYRCISKGERRGRFSLDALRSVWRFAGGIMGITLLALLLTQMDKILIARLTTLSEFGYYTLAATVASVIYMLIGPITQTYYPRFCQLFSECNDSDLAKNYHQSAQLVSILAISTSITLFFFAETFLRLWTQDIELAQKVAPLLSVLAIGNMLNCFMHIPYQTQLAYGWTSLTIWTNTVAVILLVPAIIWAMPRYGPLGAAWIWVILNTGYCLFSIQLMHRRILPEGKWYWYVWDIGAPLISALFAAKTLHWFWPEWHGVIPDLILLILAVSVTLASTLLTTDKIRKILSSKIKNRLII